MRDPHASHGHGHEHEHEIEGHPPHKHASYAHGRHAHERERHSHAVTYEELLFKPKRMTVHDLKRLMDEGKNPLILDVRNYMDYEESDVKIKGSAYIPPSQLHPLIDKLPTDRPIVIY